MPANDNLPVIAVLMTCHNRKAHTLECLELLHQQESIGLEFLLKIYLVDDGSTDATADTVSNFFPSVEIIRGDGNLFWNGGMHLAWKTALQGNYPFYLWLNDDSMLLPDALRRLLKDYKMLISRDIPIGAIAGTMVDPESKKPTYGGHLIINQFNQLFTRLINPDNKPIAADYLDGNFVLIPSDSVALIGILDKEYKHAYGDYDYSRRLIKAGKNCWIGCGNHGFCTVNAPSISPKGQASFRTRVAEVKKLSRLQPAKDHMRFIRRYGGSFWIVWWLKAWLRGSCPTLWLLLTRER